LPDLRRRLGVETYGCCFYTQLCDEAGILVEAIFGDQAFADLKEDRVVDLAGQDLIHFPLGWGIRQRVDAGFAAAGVSPVNAFEVADYAIAAELIRHRLATTILPVSVADRFPDLRKIDVNPPLVWTLSIASAGPQFTDRAIDALIDTLTRHVEH
jgi:DNA-binding transcriptional LysR family regulator